MNFLPNPEKAVQRSFDPTLNALRVTGSGGGGGGSTGIQGVTGLAGPQGATGIAGNNGSQGVTGIQGTTGVQGATGTNGTQGQTGIQGIQGIQGNTGIQGTTGIQGGTGVQGATGIQGITGLQGNTGVAGATGVQGATGIKGATGVQGTTGVQGSTGVGTTGNQGTTGVQGVTGPSGGGGGGGTLQDAYDGAGSAAGREIDITLTNKPVKIVNTFTDSGFDSGSQMLFIDQQATSSGGPATVRIDSASGDNVLAINQNKVGGSARSIRIVDQGGGPAIDVLNQSTDSANPAGLSVVTNSTNSGCRNTYLEHVGSDGVVLFINNHGTGNSIEDDSGAKLTAGGTWTDASSVALKENFVPSINALEKIDQIPVYEWSYKQESKRHIGPVSEDMFKTTGVGDDKSISGRDLAGLCLAAIKELKAEIDNLKKLVGGDL